MSAWQPIETAPKDGTRILIFVPDDDDGDCFKVAYYGGHPKQRGWLARGFWGADDVPSHWQPLPLPPEAQS